MTSFEDGIFVSDQKLDIKSVDKTLSLGKAIMYRLRGHSSDRTVLVSRHDLELNTATTFVPNQFEADRCRLR